LNLTRDLTELERISGLYGREGRSLAPSHAAALRPVWAPCRWADRQRSWRDSRWSV